MDCLEIERALLSGERVDPAAPHLRACAACRFLVDDGAAVAQALGHAARPAAAGGFDEAALEAQVLGAVRGERGPRAWLRARSRPARAAILSALIAGIAGAAFLFFRRPDWSVYPAGRMALILGALGGILVAALWQALRPLQRPPPPRWIAPGLVAGGILLPLVSALAPEVPTLAGRHAGLGSDLVCLANGALVALAVLGVFVLMARDALTLVLGAVVAALGGLAALQLECPINLQRHLLLGHAPIPPLLVLAALGVRRVVRR
jgi:hypothetical protein